MTASSVIELKQRIIDSYHKGEQDQYNGVEWTDHEGNPLCVTHIREYEFDITLENGQICVVEPNLGVN